MSKAGLKGMGILVVILLAFVYEAKASTGILLPMLIIADIIAVIYYRRSVRWDYLKRFLPWMIAGVLFGTYVGKGMPEEIFKKGMAIIILISVLIMFAWERYDKSKIPDTLWFTGSMGFAAGFTTMIGNLAGAFSNIFFLASRIPKIEFIGSAAWMFFFINLFKLPFHIWSWKTIDLNTLYKAVRELAYAGRYSEAIQVLDNMPDQESDQVLTYRGFTARKLGHVQLANIFYQRAIHANPNNLLARSYMAQGFVENGNKVSAIKQLREIQKRGGMGTWAETALRKAIETEATFSY